MSALMKEQLHMLPEVTESQWQAVLAKDSRFDGQFVFAVSTTGWVTMILSAAGLWTKFRSRRAAQLASPSAIPATDH